MRWRCSLASAYPVFTISVAKVFCRDNPTVTKNDVSTSHFVALRSSTVAAAAAVPFVQD
jgi:hypothetical protein